MNTFITTKMDKTIERLARTKFDPDPLLPLATSKACSIAESAKKRHGAIIELALLESVKAAARYEAWAPKRFLIPEPVDHLASLMAGGAKIGGAAFEYTGRGRKVQIDMAVYDREMQTLRSYEIKRGHGRNDSGKVRSMLRDLRCIQAVLISFGQSLGLQVRDAEARIVFWYGRRSVPRPWSIIGAEVDQHFGFAASAMVEEATAYFRGRVQALLEGEFNPYPLQMTLALREDHDA
jgi:hypothetical protein